MSQSFKLFRLQQIDSQLDQLKTRLQEVEKAIANNSQLLQAQEKKDTSQKKLSEDQKQLRHAEDEVKALRIKIEQTEASLYGGKVRNPKELQDLQNELAALKRHMGVLEDRQLEAMLVVEDSEAAFKSDQENFERVSSTSKEQVNALTQNRAVLIKDLERLESERQGLAVTISNEDLKIYEQIRLQRRGVAVARVADNACGACGSTLTPGLIQAASSSNQLVRCTFCGRILYAG